MSCPISFEIEPQILSNEELEKRKVKRELLAEILQLEFDIEIYDEYLRTNPSYEIKQDLQSTIEHYKKLIEDKKEEFKKS
jgi:hypothetical protein